MQKVKFNDDWSVTGFKRKRIVDFLVNDTREMKKVTLPHDAMIEEKQCEETENGGQTGFYPGKFYRYTKYFHIPSEWEKRSIVLEFEGVYMNSQVFINGAFAGGHPDGYTGFYIQMCDFLKYGQENKIEVLVNNEGQPNSRWYSGSGIYRDVNLWMGKKVHIPANGVKVKTSGLQDSYAVADFDIQVVNRDSKKHKLQIKTIVTDSEDNCFVGETTVTVDSLGQEEIRQHIGITNPKRWDCDSPNLYQAEMIVMEENEIWDTQYETFGIRTIELDPVNGLRINGKETKLRGACIHHDNGVIGACTLEKAEYRRCRRLKDAGFNCLRSSHHPMSKAMLAACDSLGMMVMDELTDMWNERKNQYDIASTFGTWWEKGTEAMVQKDYNHPSVILYSTGNEIPEAGSENGAQINRQIVHKIRSLDDTRFITNAINGNMAIMDELMTVIEDIAHNSGTTVDAIIKTGTSKNGGEGGSSGLNGLMSLLCGKMGDAIAAHPVMSRRLKEFVDAMDIAGYNYMTGRHEMEHELYPGRVVLGTETFPSEIVRLWDIVKRNPHVIGDMTWTGYDYLGEAGIGIFYYDGTNNFAARYPDKLANCGDIDLIGRRRSISYLREIVYGIRRTPYITVERMDKAGQAVSKTPWAWKDSIASWTWAGHEGKTANVDVLSDAEEVELFLNNKSLGRKEAGEASGYVASYQVPYTSGILYAVCYREGKSAESASLSTADNVAALNVELEGTSLKADGSDVSFITVGLLDNKGRENLFAEKHITIHVEGPGTLLGFGSADPRSGRSFQDPVCKTYDGYVMAVIRSERETGLIKVKISAPECETKILTIPVK